MPEHFGDELFRRNGRGLTPTAGARRLYEPLQRALADIDGTVRQAHAFDPEAMPGRFTLALSDLGEATLLPRLLAEARERAPRVSFIVRPLDVDEVENQRRGRRSPHTDCWTGWWWTPPGSRCCPTCWSRPT
jgi:DNA-binding transcriptional LysR family regulator